jgi:hypothetical protein
MKLGGDDQWFQYQLILTVASTPPTITNINVIFEQDTEFPALVSITSTSGEYKQGDEITIDLNFSEEVISSTGLTLTLSNDETVVIDYWTTPTDTVSGTYTVGATEYSSLNVSSISGRVTDKPENALNDEGSTNIPFTVNENYDHKDMHETLIRGDVGRLNSYHPSVVGSIVGDETNLNGAFSVAVSGDYAYVASQVSDSLSVVDISIPTSPNIVGSVSDSTVLNGASGVAVSGNYAYVASYLSDSLAVVDISTPSNPSVVGSVSNSYYLEEIERVAVSGNYAYVISNRNDSLVAVDISTPSSPSIVGSIMGSGSLNQAFALAVSGDYVYVGSHYGNFAVVDVSVPSSPSIVAGLSSSTVDNIRGLDVSGNYAYVTNFNDNTLAVIDISTPTAPSLVGSVSSSVHIYRPTQVTVSGDYAYVIGTYDHSLGVVDISTPSNPIVLGSLVGDTTHMNTPYGVAVSGEYIYVTGNVSDSLAVLDFYTPTPTTPYSTTPSYFTTSTGSQKDTINWTEISGVTLTQTTPAGTDLKYLVSFDGKTTWKYWDGDSWETSSLDDLETNGMNKTTLEGLSPVDWSGTGGFSGGTLELDFAVYLSTTDPNETPEIDNIAIDYVYLNPTYLNIVVDPEIPTGNNLADNASLVVDNTPPTSEVSVPDGVTPVYTNLPEISGIATDNNTVNQIDITIQNTEATSLNYEKYWNGSDWVVEETWLTNTGGSADLTTWIYDASTVAWDIDTQFTVIS